MFSPTIRESGSHARPGMRSRRAAAMFALLALLPTGDAFAQLVPGDLVRVSSSRANPTVGSLIAWEGSSLTLAVGGAPLAIELTDRSIVEVGQPRSTAHGMARGAAFGAVAGAVSGAFVWGLFAGLHPRYPAYSRFFVPEKMKQGARTVGVPMAIGGALLGAIRPGTIWRDAPPTSGLALYLTPDRDVGLKYSVRF